MHCAPEEYILAAAMAAKGLPIYGQLGRFPGLSWITPHFPLSSRAQGVVAGRHLELFLSLVQRASFVFK